MSESTGKSIFKLAGWNAIGAIIAVCQTVVIARIFGTGEEVEAFFAATALQMLLLKLSQSGQMIDFFIPVYNKLKEKEGRKRAQQALSVVLNLLTVLVILAVTGFLVFRENLFSIVAPGFDESQRLLASQLFIWIAPLLGVSVMHQTISAIANAEKIFGYPEAATVVGRCMALITVCVCAEPMGVYALVLSLAISMVCDVIASLYLCMKMQYKHRLRMKDDSVNLKFLISGFYSSLHYSGAVQLRAIALNAALTMLPQGYYAIFQYCNRLVSRSSSLILRPISVVFFSHFSSAWATGAENLESLIRKTYDQALLIVVPVVLLSIVAGRDALALIWGGETFDMEAINIAGLLLPCLLVCLLVNVLSLVYRKILTSLGMYAKLLRVLSCCQVVSAIFTYFSIIHFGLIGALAAQLFTVASQSFGGYLVLRKAKPEFALFYSRKSILLWSCGAVLALGLAFCADYLAGLPVGDLSQKQYFIISGMMSSGLVFTALFVFGACIEVPGLSVAVRVVMTRLRLKGVAV